MANQQPAKATVYYRPSKLDVIKVGGSAFIVPVNHTSPFVSNGVRAMTSKVVWLNHTTGEFETLNSIYKPLKEETNV